MRAAQHMRDLLNATGGYQLSETGEGELLAAGAALDLLSDGIEALVGDVFVLGASADHLDLWESWLRPQRSVAALEYRRKMLSRQMAICPEKGTLSDYKEMICAAGVLGRAAESESGVTVHCSGLLGLTEGEVRKELDALLPAHLPWEIEPAFDWLTMELGARTFADWDALKLIWAQLDALTREEVLERGENNGIV